jgi:hypothetical protein
MALGSTQPLTEMSTKNHPGGEGRPARKADNLTAYHPIRLIIEIILHIWYVIHFLFDKDTEWKLQEIAKVFIKRIYCKWNFKCFEAPSPNSEISQFM